ncbi:MAG: LamG-like jellyroll fold domain-containing protein [Patescibacteria group bacterium]
MIQKTKLKRYFPSFTLLELLIVIGILAVLASVSFIALNPVEQLRKARDSRRMADLKSLDNALKIYESQALNAYFGTSTWVYLSLPDTSSTCGSYALPTLPTGYSYHCATSDNLRKTDGSSWVPVNFQSLTIGSPLSVLPVDPQNNQSSYYTYVSGGSWELTAQFESGKYADQKAQDGGLDPGMYEIGTDLTLSPFTHKLFRYWDFEESSWTNNCSTNTVLDKSGYDGHGKSCPNSTGPTTPVSGKIGNAVSLDGTEDYIDIPDLSLGSDGTYSSFTLLAWVYANNKTHQVIWGDNQNSCDMLDYYGVDIRLGADTNCAAWSSTRPSYGAWHHLVLSVNDSTTAKLYLDGSLVSQKDISGFTQYWGNGNEILSFLGRDYCSGGDCWLDGMLDEVRIYTRSLSDEEVKAIYNATK